jgi:hypothetical protein
MRIVILMSSVTVVFVGVAFGQGQLPTGRGPAPAASAKKSVDASERRDELAKVNEIMASRDPLMRLAGLEEIINSGDALRTQVALRLAFQSDDADLHALAMRGYIASRKEIILDIQLPAAVQKQYDDTLVDVEKRQAFFSGDAHYYISQLAQQGFRVHYVFSKYDVSNTTGAIHDSSADVADTRSNSSFAISGDRLSASVRNTYYELCRVDFKPMGSLFKGSLSCSFFGRLAPKLDVSAPIF